MLGLCSLSPAPFGLIEFTGPERNDFLQRLLTNEVRLQAGQACPAYFLNVQGRPLLQLWVFQSADSTWVVCPKEQTERALQEFDALHFGEKLRMVDRSEEWHAQLIVGAGRREWIRDEVGLLCDEPWALREKSYALWCVFPWLASGSDLLWTKQPLPQAGAPLSEDQLELEQIQARRPGPADWGEKTMFLEVAEPEEYVDGKGCYPGQEVVARTLHRGHINRHIQVVNGTGPRPAGGAKLLREQKEVGWISRSTEGSGGWFALAYLRTEASEPGTELQLEGGQVCLVVEPRREA